MFYTYSRHRTEAQAYWALEDYFAEGLVCEGERPRVIREASRWAVQFFDGSYCY